MLAEPDGAAHRAPGAFRRLRVRALMLVRRDVPDVSATVGTAVLGAAERPPYLVRELLPEPAGPGPHQPFLKIVEPGHCTPRLSARFFSSLSAVSIIILSALRLSIPIIGILTSTASSYVTSVPSAASASR